MEGAKNSARFRSFPLDRERVNERPRFPDVQANERIFVANFCDLSGESERLGNEYYIRRAK